MYGVLLVRVLQSKKVDIVVCSSAVVFVVQGTRAAYGDVLRVRTGVEKCS